MINWLCYGKLLALLAAATMSLTIADLVLTNQYYCVNGGEGTYCQYTTDDEPYWPIWVASGLWGSLPVFLTGLLAICSGNDHEKQRWLGFLIMICGIVFTPAIVILTSVELWRGSAAEYNLYSAGNGGISEGTITPPNNPYQAKFALPCVVTIFGFLMFVMTFWVTCCTCFCSSSGPAAAAAPQQPQVVVKQEMYQPPRPQIVAQPPCEPCTRYAPMPAPPPACDPCSRYQPLPYPPVRYGFNPYTPGRGFH